MKEQHPIDELFARMLRDGEAEPPPKAWEGIVKGRMARRMRRWGWLPMLLLLGGATGLVLLARHDGRGDQGITTQALAASPGNGTLSSLASTGNPALRTDHPAMDSLNPALVPGHHAADKTSRGPDNQITAAQPATGQGPQPLRDHPAQVPENVDRGRPEIERSERASASDWSQLPRSVAVAPDNAGKTIQSTTSAMQVAGEGIRVPVPVGTRAEGEALRAFRLTLRGGYAAPPPPTPTPTHAPGINFAGRRHNLWIAALAGQYRETRHWVGGDGQLREALNGTEVPHSTYSAGLMGGVDLPGGWSLGAGVEYRVGRFDFRHADRFQVRRDSIISQVLTFNSLVLATITDTITTFSSVNRSVSAINRYSTWRIPVELGWHKGLRRFRLGARAGLALELNAMHSGATLVRGSEGTQSADVATTQVSCTSLLAGSVAADVGFVLTEHLVAWVSPVHEFGLLSLLPSDDLPVALPNRTGLRLGLSYHLHH